MIRIDEIYNNTFWPWIKNNLPLTRMFFCDPPGDSRPEALFNFGSDVSELQYIFFHDQEPIHLDIHDALFSDVRRRNIDLDFGQGPKNSAIITSEYNSEFVETACKKYGWKPFYYFFHGWASLDWYRGYDKTFLIPDPAERNISQSFISPNRIIGGKRDHRVLLMYHLLRANISNACISFPRVCPEEKINIMDIVEKHKIRYPDIENVFSNCDLPLCFPGETDHPMHSCWLSLFEENSKCLAHVITETVFSGRRHHLTEKTFKPICLQMPFVMVSTAGSLEYLKSYGFRTFGDLWDESYDSETDDAVRLQKISRLLKQFDDMRPDELQKLYQASIPTIQHNYHHFYHGGFEKILWEELQSMLRSLKDELQ